MSRVILNFFEIFFLRLRMRKLHVPRCQRVYGQGQGFVVNYALEHSGRRDTGPARREAPHMEHTQIRKDYHLHCRFSTDSQAAPEAMCEAAIARGLTEICFTDHQDLGFDDPTWFRFDPDAYFTALQAVKAAYAGRLEVHIGMELGLVPDNPKLAREAEALARDYPWEFIIGSTHVIPVESDGQLCLVDPADPAQAQRSWYRFGSTRGLMTVYYETVLKNLEQFDFFDTVGHIDYMNRYIPHDLEPYRYEAHEAQIDRILRAAIRKNVAIEINTGGLYKGSGATNPEDRIIRRYLALGGKQLTYGSDAHRPEHVGFGFARLPCCEQEEFPVRSPDL